MADRFIPSDYAVVVIAPTVADLSAPTRSEINAGTVLASPDMGDEILGLEAIAGLERQEQTVTGADVNSRVDKKYPGRQQLPDATLTFFDADDGSGAIRTALAEGTTGVLIIMKYGDVAGRRCECWPGRVSTVNDSQITSANELAKFVATWVVNAEPNTDAVIPAA